MFSMSGKSFSVANVEVICILSHLFISVFSVILYELFAITIFFFRIITQKCKFFNTNFMHKNASPFTWRLQYWIFCGKADSLLPENFRFKIRLSVGYFFSMCNYVCLWKKGSQYIRLLFYVIVWTMRKRNRGKFYEEFFRCIVIALSFGSASTWNMTYFSA